MLRQWHLRVHLSALRLFASRRPMLHARRTAT